MKKHGEAVRYSPARKAIDNVPGRQAYADIVIKFQWRTPERYFVYMDYHHDVGFVSSGDGADLLLSRSFIFRQALFDHDCMLVPAIGIRWDNDLRVDYYYGVRQEEATADRPAYAGRKTSVEMARL